MSLDFYFDDNISTKPLILSLLAAGIPASTADQHGNRGLPDDEHLSFAAAHGLTLVTADEGDFSALHWRWLAEGSSHFGIVVVRQRTSIGAMLGSLIHLHEEVSKDEARNSLIYLSRY